MVAMATPMRNPPFALIALIERENFSTEGMRPPKGSHDEQRITSI